MNRHPDPARFHTVMNAMLHRIFDQWLKNHTRNTNIFDAFIYFFDIGNISRKTDIQNINIVINGLYFFPEHRIFFHLAYIISKKICHFFQKNTCLVRISHHGKLRSCIETVKQKMRVDLCLQIFELCFFKMCFHKKLPFFHLCLTLHTVFQLIDTLADAFQHLVKASGYNSNFILYHNRKLRDI